MEQDGIDEVMSHSAKGTQCARKLGSKRGKRW